MTTLRNAIIKKWTLNNGRREVSLCSIPLGALFRSELTLLKGQPANYQEELISRTMDTTSCQIGWDS
eukprot:1870461-Amphidinium_carterae.1